jgi:hypothetical protein
MNLKIVFFYEITVEGKGLASYYFMNKIKAQAILIKAQARRLRH